MFQARLCPLLLLGSALCAQIKITEVGPAASHTPNHLPSGGIAPGSYFFIKGTALGPATHAHFTPQGDYLMQTSLAGVSAKVQVGPVTVDAFPNFVSATQVNLLLPSSIPTGVGTVTISFNGAQASAPIRITTTSFGIFTSLRNGSGTAVITDSFTGLAANSSNPLNPGQRVILWGTGLGAVPFADQRPAFAQRVGPGATVVIGGKSVIPEYAGRVAGASGLDQVIFTVPEGISGCSLPILVHAGNVVSNQAYTAVSAPGARCTEPAAITEADVAAAQAAGGFSVGNILLNGSVTSSGTITTRSDTAGASFTRYALPSFTSGTTLGAVPPPPGSCLLSILEPVTTPLPVLPPIANPPIRLDAGQLTIRNATTSTGFTESDGTYLALGLATSINGTPIASQFPPPFLTPGTVTISGTGGADIGAFSVPITVPPALNWTNQGANANIVRNRDLTLTWTGGASPSMATIFGSAADDATGYRVAFTCFETASAGRFTIPRHILSALPATTTGAQRTGLLTVGLTAPPTRFQAPGLIYGTITFRTSVSGGAVNYQ